MVQFSGDGGSVTGARTGRSPGVLFGLSARTRFFQYGSMRPALALRRPGAPPSGHRCPLAAACRLAGAGSVSPIHREGKADYVTRSTFVRGLELSVCSAARATPLVGYPATAPRSGTCPLLVKLRLRPDAKPGELWLGLRARPWSGCRPAYLAIRALGTKGPLGVPVRPREASPGGARLGRSRKFGFELVWPTVPGRASVTFSG